MLIAIGFSHPEHEGFVAQLGSTSTRAATSARARPTAPPQAGVYACGDARIGQSLVVTAIAEGRKCARIVNRDLGGSPMDADREKLAIGAWSGVEDHTLRHEAEAAGNVRLGDDFFSGPGGTDLRHGRDPWRRSKGSRSSPERKLCASCTILLRRTCASWHLRHREPRVTRVFSRGGAPASCSAGIVSPTIPGCGGPGWIRALPRIWGRFCESQRLRLCERVPR